MKIAAIVLAAGQSSRFGDGNKLLANVGGVPLIKRVVSALSDSPVCDIILVTENGAGAGDIIKAAGDGRWRHLQNGRAADGMASSLIIGLDAVADDTDGALVALADMPYVSPALIETLCAAFTMCRGKAIVFPQRENGLQGHPVIWPRSFFSALQKLTGDQGGKSVLAAHREHCHPIPYSDDSAYFDVDTADDLSRARKLDD